MDTGGQGQRMTGEEAGTADGQGGTELKAKGEAWGIADCGGADSKPCGNCGADGADAKKGICRAARKTHVAGTLT